MTTRSATGSPLVGRTAELALLSNAMDEAAKGSGRSVFIVGEGGIGKTRLAAAAAERAARKGWSVAVGRAYPVETGVPYALFSDALRPMVSKLEPATLSLLTRGGASEFVFLFPHLSAAGARGGASAGADPADIKARLHWNFAQFLGRLSAKQPLFIVLENLQWADASSLELLHFLARQIGEQKLMLVGTYNEAERDANPVLRTSEQSLLRLGVLAVQKLSPLSQLEVEDLIRGMFGSDGAATKHFSALLYDFTHPLLQQVLYSELGQARVRRLHALIAEALESVYGDDAVGHADELALHFARAHSDPLERKAVRYLNAAGRSALEKYANREAANCLAAAL